MYTANWYGLAVCAGFRDYIPGFVMMIIRRNQIPAVYLAKDVDPVLV